MENPQKQSALPDAVSIDVRPQGNNATNSNPSTSSRLLSLWQYALFFCLAFSLINVIILYVLHFHHNAFGSSGSSAEIDIGSNSLFSSSSDNSNFAKNKGLSYNAQGQLVAGAGTTVYLKAGKFDMDEQLRYINAASTDPTTPQDTILVSYVQGTTSILTTAKVDADNKLTINEAKEENKLSAQRIRGISTLSPELAVVAISDGYLGMSYASVIIDKDKDIRLHPSIPKTTTSTFNTMGRLSDNKFVTVYYDMYTDDPQLQNILIGTVSGSSIAFSNPLKFGQLSKWGTASTTYGVPVQVTVDNKVAFALPWWTNIPETSSSNLTDSLCIFVGEEINGQPVKMTETCSERYRPAYRADNGVAIASNKIAFAVYDQNSNYGLVVIIAEITSHGVLFGEGYVIPGTNKGPFNFGEGYAWSPSASVTLLGNNRLAVGFHDNTADALPSTAVLSFSPSKRLTPVSPVVPFTTTSSFVGMSNCEAKKSYATTLSVAAFSNGRYFASFLGPKDDIVQAQASVVQSSNPTIGIIKDQSDSKTSMAFNGVYDGLENLKQGYTYYVTGTGDIRGCDASKSSVGSGAVLIDNELIVSNDAQIGIATDEETLLLLPGFNKAASAA